MFKWLGQFVRDLFNLGPQTAFNAENEGYVYHVDSEGNPVFAPLPIMYVVGLQAYLTGLDASIAALQQSRSFGSTNFSGSTTATKLSATRDTQVSYDFEATVTGIIGGQSVKVFLEYADNSSMTANVVLVKVDQLSNAALLGLSRTDIISVSGIIPANKYRKCRFAVTGTGTATPSVLAANQEVLL